MEQTEGKQVAKEDYNQTKENTSPLRPVALYKNVHHQDESNNDAIIIPHVKYRVPYKNIPMKSDST